MGDTAANARRDQALAALQAQDPGLQVSFTLPVLPSGLTADERRVLTGAVQAGSGSPRSNVMAMDYGDGAAPEPERPRWARSRSTPRPRPTPRSRSALGISDAAAWSKVAVTPMIGVNDTSDEIFTRGQRPAAGRVRREQAPGLAVHVVRGPGHRSARAARSRLRRSRPAAASSRRRTRSCTALGAY